MPKRVLTNAYVAINGVNLSSRVRSVEISQEWEDLDSTAMGDTFRQHEIGVGNDTVTIEFYQDRDTGLVDQTIAPLLGSNAGFPVEFREVNGAVSATNPRYTGTAKIVGYQPLAGSHGEMSMTTVQLVTNGLTRAIT